ncbi:DUF2306 domain-containing protein [Indioceanicola profundi]|uniref:DUF2306 domain-containing protein n=1 Tax=Indioceanicola profundi TaxID=2220096 RepID=UPI0013C3F747|nr:DUF2306 domain-containing protein [Indioceanicola profundi]
MLVALTGQLIFAVYIAAVYGGVLLGGGPESWNRSPALAYRPDDLFGNLMFGLHALFALIIIAGGMLQMIPAIRRRFPAFHRRVGQTYLVAATILATGGIILIIWRGTVGSTVMQIGSCLNGIVILVCASFTWAYAYRRRFDQHRRWALRLFLSVSGVWFFRISLMLWLLIFQAPVGFDPDSFTGPLLLILTYGQFLLPLAILELYFCAQNGGSAATKLGMACLLVVLALLTAGGIFGAAMGMWLPRM